MIDLLKTDFKRVLKDKLFIVICIIGGVFAVITPILYKLIFSLLNITGEDMGELAMLGLGFDAKSMFFSSFSLGNNFGLILPVFIVIIMCKDFGNGTIRNKIICGKSRASIYFSLLITCAVFTCAFILAHAFLTLLLALLFFDYQTAEFTASDFGYLMASIGFEMLIYLLISAILTFFIVFMKNAGLSIVMYFVVLFAMIIVGGITQASIMFVEPTNSAYKILEFFNVANVFTTMAIGSGTSYELKQVLYILLPNLAILLAIVTLGFVVFRKKDIK